MKDYISKNLAFLVKNSGFSQDDFGEVFNLNKGVIGSYIRGTTKPKIPFIQKLCKYYSIPIDDFINKDIRVEYSTSYEDSEKSGEKKMNVDPNNLDTYIKKMIDESVSEKFTELEKKLRFLEDKMDGNPLFMRRKLF